MTEKILVPIGSIEHDYTFNAVREAIDFASSREKDVELILLHLEYVESDLPKPERKRLVKAKEEEMKKEFDIIEEECRERGLSDIETVVREGKPDEEIVEAAGEEGVDLIVMGSGRLHDGSVKGRVKRFLYGSTTEEVVHETPCSILIARPSKVGGEG